MAQFARPASDTATGSWTSTPLWSKVDEGATGDNVTITSADNTSPDNADFACTSVTDPTSSSGHILRAAWNKSATAGHTINAILELWQGTPGTGTLIATLTTNNIGATEQTDTYTLSGTEADNITNYAALSLRLSRQGDTGGNPSTRRSLVCDFCELEVPDAAVSYTLPVTAASFAVTGQTVNLVAARNVAVSAASYAITDQTVGLAVGYVVPVAAAGFTVTDQTINLTADRQLPVAAASFAVTGQDVTLTYTSSGYTLPVDAASTGVTGQNVTLAVGHVVPVAAASVAFTGQDVGFAQPRALLASPASFTVTGQDITLTYSGGGAPKAKKVRGRWGRGGAMHAIFPI